MRISVGAFIPAAPFQAIASRASRRSPAGSGPTHRQTLPLGVYASTGQACGRGQHTGVRAFVRGEADVGDMGNANCGRDCLERVGEILLVIAEDRIRQPDRRRVDADAWSVGDAMV